MPEWAPDAGELMGGLFPYLSLYAGVAGAVLFCLGEELRVVLCDGMLGFGEVHSAGLHLRSQIRLHQVFLFKVTVGEACAGGR